MKGALEGRDPERIKANTLKEPKKGVDERERVEIDGRAKIF